MKHALLAFAVILWSFSFDSTAGDCVVKGNTIECPSEAPKPPPATLPGSEPEPQQLHPRQMRGARYVASCGTEHGSCVAGFSAQPKVGSECYCYAPDGASRRSGIIIPGGPPQR